MTTTVGEQVILDLRNTTVHVHPCDSCADGRNGRRSCPDCSGSGEIRGTTRACPIDGCEVLAEIERADLAREAMEDAAADAELARPVFGRFDIGVEIALQNAANVMLRRSR